MKIVACTTCKLKLQIIHAIMNPITITTYDTSQSLISQRPLNYGYFCCQEQICTVKKKILKQQLKYDYIISIENVIDFLTQGSNHYYVQTCYVIIEDLFGTQYRGIAFGIPIHKNYLDYKPLNIIDQYSDLNYMIGSAVKQCWNKINP